ncbi:MAG: hypothetical protein RQ752_08740, partial [Thermohalobaculum sp.]|nr:hypothetical protein [Thermohalobaculum sp.]
MLAARARAQARGIARCGALNALRHDPGGTIRRHDPGGPPRSVDQADAAADILLAQADLAAGEGGEVLC